MSLLKRIGGSQPQSTEPSTAVSAPTGAPASAPDNAATPRATVTSSGGDVSQQRMLELSLWIVDRILSSLGNQQELKRSPKWSGNSRKNSLWRTGRAA
jgi:pilus assembly protein CpaF